MAKKGFQFTHLEEDFDDAENVEHVDLEMQPQSLFPNANDFVPHIDSTAAVKNETTISLENSAYSHKDEHSTFDYQILNDQTNPTHTGGKSKLNYQVQYADGKISMMQDAIVVRPDGTAYIDTQGIPIRWSEHERPLRKRRLLMTKIFAIIACVLFFPAGAPAVYYAFRAETEFQDGITRANIDRALKFAKRSEKFIFMSFVMTVVVAALIATIIKKPSFTDMPRGTLVG